jgi:hypothetical protein
MDNDRDQNENQSSRQQIPVQQRPVTKRDPVDTVFYIIFAYMLITFLKGFF